MEAFTNPTNGDIYLLITVECGSCHGRWPVAYQYGVGRCNRCGAYDWSEVKDGE